LPLRAAGRPTYINLLAIEASILVYKRDLLSLGEIKTAVEAFMLSTKSQKQDNLPLDSKEINKAMKLGNKVMSEKVIQMWIDQYTDHLFWRKELKRTKAFHSNKRIIMLPQLYLHEFIYLITNAVNKLSYVLLY